MSKRRDAVSKRDPVKRRARKGSVFHRQLADGSLKYRVTDDVRRFDNGSVVYRCMPAEESVWGEERPLYLSEDEVMMLLREERSWR